MRLNTLFAICTLMLFIKKMIAVYDLFFSCASLQTLVVMRHEEIAKSIEDPVSKSNYLNSIFQTDKNQPIAIFNAEINDLSETTQPFFTAVKIISNQPNEKAFYLKCDNNRGYIYSDPTDHKISSYLEFDLNVETPSGTTGVNMNKHVLYCRSIFLLYSETRRSTFECDNGLGIKNQKDLTDKVNTLGSVKDILDSGLVDLNLTKLRKNVLQTNKWDYITLEPITTNLNIILDQLIDELKLIIDMKDNVNSLRMINVKQIKDFISNKIINIENKFILDGETKKIDIKWNVNLIEESIKQANDSFEGISFKFYMTPPSSNVQDQEMEEKPFIYSFFQYRGLIYIENSNFIRLVLKSSKNEYNISISRYLPDKINNVESYLLSEYGNAICDIITTLHSTFYNIDNKHCVSSEASPTSLQLTALTLNKIAMHYNDKNTENPEMRKNYMPDDDSAVKDKYEILFVAYYDNKTNTPKGLPDKNVNIYEKYYKTTEIEAYYYSPPDVKNKLAEFSDIESMLFPLDYTPIEQNIDLQNFFSEIKENNHLLMVIGFKQERLVLYIDIYDYSDEFYKSYLIKLSNAFFTTEYIIPVGNYFETATHLNKYYVKVKEQMIQLTNNSYIEENGEPQIKTFGIEELKNALSEVMGENSKNVCMKEKNKESFEIYIEKNEPTGTIKTCEEKEIDPNNKIIFAEQVGTKIKLSLFRLNKYNENIKQNATSSFEFYTNKNFDFKPTIIDYLDHNLNKIHESVVSREPMPIFCLGDTVDLNMTMLFGNIDIEYLIVKIDEINTKRSVYIELASAIVTEIGDLKPENLLEENETQNIMQNIVKNILTLLDESGKLKSIINYEIFNIEKFVETHRRNVSSINEIEKIIEQLAILINLVDGMKQNTDQLTHELDKIDVKTIANIKEVINLKITLIVEQNTKLETDLINIKSLLEMLKGILDVNPDKKGDPTTNNIFIDQD